MENDIFSLLVRLTLAVSAALVIAMIARKPIRAYLGAGNAYLFWCLVPLAALVALLPAPEITVPRETPVVAAPGLQGPAISDTAARALFVQPGAGVEAQPQEGAQALPPLKTTPVTTTPVKTTPGQKTVTDSGWISGLAGIVAGANWPAIIVAVWIIGAAASFALLVIRQGRFLRSLGRLERTNDNIFVTALKGFGPAIVGALRPQLVVPADFRDAYTPEEQALILAHERRHLSRGDAQVNGFVALMKCLFWFNPLVGIAGRHFYLDQEIACDADVLAGTEKAHGAYARALLKAQLAAHGVPLGCTWPAGQGNALRERLGAFDLLAGNAARRRSGAVALTFGIVGLSAAAWGLQPPAYVDGPADEVAEAAQQTPATPAPVERAPKPAAISTVTAAPSPQVAYRTASSLPAPVARHPEGTAYGVSVNSVAPHVAGVPAIISSRAYSVHGAAVAPTVAVQDQADWEPDGNSYIDGLKKAGLDNLEVDDLIALKVQGVSADYVSAHKASGFDMSVDTLIAFKVQGVTPAYVKDMRDAFPNVRENELIGLKVQGVSADYVAGIRKEWPTVSANEVIAMKVQGVSSDYVGDLRKVWPDLTANEVIAMRVQGVRAADAEGFKDIGFASLTADQAIAFRVMGVTPDYIKSLRKTGIKKQDPDQYIWAKSMGVTAAYVAHLEKRGFKDLTLDKVVQLKSAGID